ncbi:TetR/AcrR family transcriptional regulator [Gilvimarinus sp. SDUM040013]|uniref:TetR/AcrR family transcriptional regulator n=1 Tax=Gilvimarinus gilvus TaxID=3058038 RepID=A0ABU4RZA6_9GAMM|nr:TetR/AcrR family transcriptional regulator [Gilvimarinus sp. SDUM040013]MDO3386751.1 TetR/AcrR family transcriptional regulator [Gilvimarinus sp. SDUM040013]MDX6848319.1 TetR/AcrR family transcriptional regulator [Gilvimarinus sp. SDUM040013]
MSAVETRERLLSTALDLIWQSNYSSVGVNEICKQAGVTKGGFYHHFESKAQLFCEATEFYWNNVKQHFDELYSPSQSPLEQLESVLSFILQSKLDEENNDIPGCAFFSAGSQCGNNDDRIQQALRDMSNASIRYNLSLVRALAGEGYLEDGVDQDQAARYMHQYIQGVLIFGKVHRNLDQVRADLPEGVYRLLGLKREYWPSSSPK